MKVWNMYLISTNADIFVYCNLKQKFTGNFFLRICPVKFLLNFTQHTCLFYRTDALVYKHTFIGKKREFKIKRIKIDFNIFLLVFRLLSNGSHVNTLLLYVS